MSIARFRYVKLSIMENTGLHQMVDKELKERTQLELESKLELVRVMIMP